MVCAPAEALRKATRRPYLGGLTLALVAVTAAAHPLDPLSEDVIQLAVTLVRADKGFPAGALFPSVVLAEPKRTKSWPGSRARPNGARRPSPSSTARATAPSKPGSTSRRSGC